MTNLLILESPNKIHTVSKILEKLYPNDTWTVKATAGHFVNLKKDGKYNCGIDLTTFTESYEIESKKSSLIKELKTLVKASDYVYIASDNDMQGEYIGWTMEKFLSIPAKKLRRVRFNEITESGVKTGMQNPGKLNQKQIEAARTQRMVDRLVGFRTSAAIRREKCEAAGRVQSVVLGEIFDRDQSIKNFKPEEYFEIYLPFTKNKKKFQAQYTKKIKDKKTAEKVVKECKPGEYFVNEIKIKTRKQSSQPGFTTSTLQQAAITNLGYSSSVTSKLAQSLFEGKTIQGVTGGLITYIRTDSTRMSEEFIAEAKKLIETSYGKEYYKGFTSDKKAPSVGGAHECIRPTKLKEWTPAVVKPFLTSQEYKLYELIYNRALSSLMSDSKIEDTCVIIGNNSHTFSISGHRVLFDGFSKVYDKDKNSELPNFVKGEKINEEDLLIVSKFTNPPSKYNESSVIKFMEKEGIGRPSTYAATIENLKKHKYISIDKKQISVTEIGEKATGLMRKYFPDVMKISYTADLEKNIDKISEGEEKYLDILNAFYKPFHESVLKANKEIAANKPAMVLLDEKCPECGAALVERESKSGTKFLACSKFPRCRFTKPIEIEGQKKVKCPKCDGTLVARKNRKGEVFYGCSNFAKTKCDGTMTAEEFDKA